jgi:flagellar motor switch protein FliN/FliY
MPADERLSEDDIQRLLDEKLGKAGGTTATAPTSPVPVPTSKDPGQIDQKIDKLLASAEAGVKQAAAAATSNSAKLTEPYQLTSLQPDPSKNPLASSPLELLADVELDLRIELGRTQMRLEEILQLRGGAVVALDKLAGDPVDVYVNDRMIARGEILVLNENFCVRVTELLSGS